MPLAAARAHVQADAPDGGARHCRRGVLRSVATTTRYQAAVAPRDGSGHCLLLDSGSFFCLAGGGVLGFGAGCGAAFALRLGAAPCGRGATFETGVCTVALCCADGGALPV